jgi:hypothetical protein
MSRPCGTHAEKNVNICPINCKECQLGKQSCRCRYYRVLTMVYNTQRYWGFGLCPSSGEMAEKIRRNLEKQVVPFY